MKTLAEKKYYEEGTELFEAWLNARKKDGFFIETVTVRPVKYKHFTYEEDVWCFEHKGKAYTECGIDHFNGHFSNFTDRSALYGVYLRQIKTKPDYVPAWISRRFSMNI
jgi:hypothetical protein